MASEVGKRRLLAISLTVAVLAAGAYFSKWPGWPGTDAQPLPDSGQEAMAPGATGASVAGSYLPPNASSAKPLDPVALRAALAEERKISARPEAQPPKTYIGPDGKPHEIVYNKSWILSLTPVEKEQYQAELMDQLKQNPQAFAKLYNLDPKFVEEVAAGRKPFPSAVMQ